MKLLEEFRYGNIESTDYDTSCAEYKKLQEERGKAQNFHDG